MVVLCGGIPYTTNLSKYVKKDRQGVVKHVCKTESYVLKYRITMETNVQEDVFYGLQINL